MGDYPITSKIVQSAFASGAANAEAEITIEAVEGKAHLLTYARAGYDGTPAAATRLSVKSDTTEIDAMYVGSAVPHEFHRKLWCTSEEDLVVTLPAGGSGVSCLLAIEYQTV